MCFHTWMSCVLFSLFVSLRNLYISLESIRKRHISKIAHSFKFSLYSNNYNKRKTNRKLKKKKKKKSRKSGRMRNRTMIGQKLINVSICPTTIPSAIRLTRLTIVNGIQQKAKWYSISILMKNTDCSLEINGGR